MVHSEAWYEGVSWFQLPVLVNCVEDIKVVEAKTTTSSFKALRCPTKDDEVAVLVAHHGMTVSLSWNLSVVLGVLDYVPLVLAKIKLS